MYRIICRLPLLLSVLAVAGCSQTTGPNADPLAVGEGRLDPRDGRDTFVLSRIVQPDQGIFVELVGSNVQITNVGVRIDVAVRNMGSEPLFAPAAIVIDRFHPDGVYPADADDMECPFDSTGADSIGLPPDLLFCRFVYDYTGLLGEDRILEPGEISARRGWTFVNPATEAFSFRAQARFGPAPGSPRIGGRLFFDHNENGVYDDGDAPWAGGVILVTGPGEDARAQSGRDGTYEVPVQKPGLYQVRALEPPTMSPLPWIFTTPNPLEVVLPPDANGNPQSFDHADFGVTTHLPGPPPVILHDGDPKDLEVDPYRLIEMGLMGPYLNLEVGFSGCSPDHPFSLYMVGDFFLPPGQPSQDPRVVFATLVLTHDDRGEACLAAWQRSLSFGLDPVVDAFFEQMDPQVKHELVLMLTDPQGNVGEVILPLGPIQTSP